MVASGERKGAKNNDGQLKDKDTMCKINKLQKIIVLHGKYSQY